MNWTIRRMTAADIDAVVALAEEIPEAPRWRREAYEECNASDEAASLQRVGFVAEASSRLLGFSAGKLVMGVSELESIAVSADARGRGIGRALFEAVEKWAQAHGANRMELEVRALNIGAIKLYEQCGLCREGLRQAYYQSPEEDALLMGMPLAAGGKLSSKTHCQCHP